MKRDSHQETIELVNYYLNRLEDKHHRAVLAAYDTMENVCHEHYGDFLFDCVHIWLFNCPTNGSFSFKKAVKAAVDKWQTPDTPDSE